MAFTWGFLVLFVLILIPGLVIRKLFYYGEFSRQFGGHLPLIKLIFYLLIPGMINAITASYLFHSWIEPIDLGAVIDIYKDLAHPTKRFKSTEGYPILFLAHSKAMPFTSVLYTTALIIGTLSGRIIRITGADLRWKLLRFKNTWFYLFNGHHNRLKRYSDANSERPKNHKFQFTQADILITAPTKNTLYSGIVVDYELETNSCENLKTLVLKNAIRYSKSYDGKRKPKSIPGNLLVVNCEHLDSVNLTFIYGEKKSTITQKLPKYIMFTYAVFCALMIPVFIFKIRWIEWDYYVNLFEYPIWTRILPYLTITQLVYIFIPFTEVESNRYRLIGLGMVFLKLVLVAAFHFGYKLLIALI